MDRALRARRDAAGRERLEGLRRDGERDLDVRDAVVGALEESIPIGTPAAFPPVVDKDRVYVSTTDGRVISVKL